MAAQIEISFSHLLRLSPQSQQQSLPQDYSPIPMVQLPAAMHNSGLASLSGIHTDCLCDSHSIQTITDHLLHSPQQPQIFPFCFNQLPRMCVQFFATPWAAAHQASLSITNSQSLLKLMSIESVMPSKHLILCHPLLLPPSIFPSIRVFSNESALRIRWPKY